MFNGVLFQQSLQDLVKGIRAHRRDEDEFIRSKVAEIGDECRSSDMAKKTTAVLKLTHLQMMGHSIAFASFHVVEVMSSPVFASKRIGYLAAAQSFSPTTDVLLLTTNQFKKDLTNGKLQDCSQALTCLAKLVTEELGRDLEHDVSLLLNSPRPYIRKKALLVLYRLIMVHPDTLAVVSSRFRERLTDKDPGVVCGAVTVTCELARASPRSFLSLAPVLYQLLTNKESNNWMLIKIVKLMGVLTPLEPRLGKKLVEPLTTLMRTTRAKSLLYECCSTVTSGLMAHPEAVELCAQRLGEFMDESDQNLKYLGLLSMRKLIQAHPHLALEHRDNILDCLDDEDIGIRMRALEVVSEFVTKRTLQDISRILLKKLRKATMDGFSLETLQGTPGVSNESGDSPYIPVTDYEAPYRESLARELLRAGVCRRASNASQAGYEMLSSADDFAWYATTILGGLAELPSLSSDVRIVIGEQLLELTSKVEAIRPVSVNVALSLLKARRVRRAETMGSLVVTSSTADMVNKSVDSENDMNANADENGGHVPIHGEESTEVASNTADPKDGYGKLRLESEDALLAPTLAGSCAWILGEYSELIENYVAATDALVAFPRKSLDSPGQVRVLTACVKVYSSCPDDVATVIYDAVLEYIGALVDSEFAEVQERAWLFKAMLTKSGRGNRQEIAPIFDGKLVPVDYRAQSKIQVADDLDLGQPLLDTGTDSLYIYLLKTVGGVEQDDEVADDDEGLFKEAVFSNATLSFNGARPSAGGTFANQNSLLGSLPEANKEKSPFYLGASSDASSKKVASTNGNDFDADSSRYSYERGQLSSEAAVIIAEDKPHGLTLSDDEAEPPEHESIKVNERLQAAFEGAFDGPRPKSRSKKDGKRKKKRKDSMSRKDEDKAVIESNGKAAAAEVSLIDFDVSPAPSGDTPPSADKSGPAPKHLADSLLM